MARIIVTNDARDRLMDEYVVVAHLSDDHASGQLMERLVWAVNEAERRPRPARAGNGARRRRRGTPMTSRSTAGPFYLGERSPLRLLGDGTLPRQG